MRAAVNRAIGWIGVTFLGVVPFVAVVLGLRAHLGENAISTAVLFGALLIGMRLFLSTVQPRLDSMFGRRRRDLAHELELVAEQAARLQPTEELGRVIDRCLRALERRLAALVVLDPHGRPKVAHSAWGAVPAPSRRSSFLTEISGEKGRVTRELARAEGRFEVERACVRWGADFLAPLYDGSGHLVGVLAVSPKRDGARTDAVEAEVLDRTEVIATAALVATQLYERVRLLGDELEQKANARSLDLAKALRDLRGAQQRLVQGHKLALLGQIVGGIATDLSEQVDRIHAQIAPIRNSMSVLVEASRPAADVPAAKAAAATPTGVDEIARDLDPLLDSISEGARRAHAIARDLSGFAPQGGVGAPAFPRQRVVLAELIESTLKLVTVDLGEVRVARAYAADLPTVEVEPGPLGQVVLNLVLNALQAMSGRGILTLSTKRASSQVEFTVSDTGPGIAPDVLPRIFEPFFSTKESAAGTGLGLWLSAGIVERQGGQLLVDSKPGRGTVFTVRLPIADG
jgi:signal transduction histidine kinase